MEIPSDMHIAITASSKDLALRYAYVAKGRFPEGEPAIATDAHSSYYYAWHIIHSRFPLGEPIIQTSSMYSDLYNRFIIAYTL